ncbi:ankyrin repeat domain-containing protein 49 [Caerostris darwini]|uniref:Alpha-latrotoxin n=1 Tax=Caerostris darwini TaxID=1538125 RepID=A0AAV4NVR4_9ARAC|nr:ankyrin repeat domain-containing protein 49 [Caerostris darwini]
MSEKLDSDSNNAANTEMIENNDETKTECKKQEYVENEGEDDNSENLARDESEPISNDENVERQDNEQDDCELSVDRQDSSENLDSKSSVETIKKQFSNEEVQRQSSVESKGRQSSVEEKSQSAWSYSQWSENYESLDDERPIEDLNGDPEKLILWAAEKNELETMRKLLEEDPTLVNARDNDLYTPLHRASYSNNVEVIKMLLSYDADISSKTTDGWEALHCACKWDSVEAVSLLIQNGANVNAQTKGHITPLHLAASNASGRRTLELLLWQPYIDPNIKNDAGDTAYDIAYRTGPLGALFEILEESVNIY